MSGKAEVLALLKLVNQATNDALAAYEASGEDVPSLTSLDTKSLSSMSDNLALKKAVRLLEGASDQLCATLAPPANTVINRVVPYDWACMRVAIHVRVADVLSEHPDGLHVDELGPKVNIEKGKLARILRLLATRHCFREVRPNVFVNNRLSLVLRSDNPLSDLADVHLHEVYKAALVLHENLSDPVRGPSYKATESAMMQSVQGDGKITFFDYLKANPGRRETFARAMFGMGSVMGTLAALEGTSGSLFPWADYKTICDVASGVGPFSTALVRQVPGVKVILCDLPEVIGQAKDLWSKDHHDIIEAQRVEFVPFNFFEGSPPTGLDIYYLRNIIHNWPDAEAETILRNVQKAMRPGSRLLVHDYVVQYASRIEGDISDLQEMAPEPLLPNFGAGSLRMYGQDLTMLLTYNAKERTVRDLADLSNRAGLRVVKVWDIAETDIVELQLMTGD
ncbi:S-adenosyl-L-methionine-dependent methyltransferase [Fomitopsis serialis]|uniref:S-adenosyl-L-methionine-dependent methyltransferase n=1 Tax=Fomitopsis serialis TaxID=139415 RepID=UPI0020077A95|nr:S-adenosyl-L-methionine-dependent methyltransferase [Neoantrodia serialis]KAH9922934.1 S-adenosyl-L-methionine-dependent methyltransferase [Neoantrodia serialis]